MATITSTVNDFTMQSSYTCTTGWLMRYSSYGTEMLSSNVVASSASMENKTITFNYQNIGTEKVNMAILQLTSVLNTFGGTFRVNGTQVYPSGGKYTVYLTPSDIGATSTTFNLSFVTYTEMHSHMTGYDTITEEVVQYSSQHSVIKYTSKTSHTGRLQLGEITLKIYTGDDVINVPSIAGFFVGENDVARKVSDMYIGVSNKARKISDGWVGINGVARKFWPCLALQNVTPGSILKLDEKGDGNLVDYIVVAQNHYLNDINTKEHTVLMRKELLDQTTKFGENTWGEAYIGENLDIYVNEAWKAGLDGRIILKLMNITIPCNQWSSPYTSSAERQVWVPSWSELNETYTSEPGEGTCFEYFIGKNTAADRIAKTSNGTAQAWWTRSCLKGMGSDGAYIRIITANGNLNSYGQHASYRCRPVFCLPADLPVSQLSEGTYDLIL